MGLSFGEGVAFGMLGASADSARNEAEYQTGRANRLQNENDVLKRQVQDLQKQLAAMTNARDDAHHSAVQNVRGFSAGLIIMNGMIKGMEMLPADLRERFRTEVVQHANERMDALDAKICAEVVGTNYVATTIRKVFSQEPQYKILGFTK